MSNDIGRFSLLVEEHIKGLLWTSDTPNLADIKLYVEGNLRHFASRLDGELKHYIPALPSTNTNLS